MALRAYLAGEVVEDHADGLLTRREALRRLVLLGVSLSSASTLLAACSSGGTGGEDRGSATSGDGPAAASDGPVPSGAQIVRFAGASGQLQGALAQPDGDPRGALLVIHENKGLTPHFVDLPGRLAGEGYSALAVDLLSPEGGTASLADEGAAQAALAKAPMERLLEDLGSGIDELGRRAPGAKIGAVGFCFGGGMTWSLLNAGEARLAAAVPFYGPAPDDPDFTGAQAAVLAIYGELDQRVNATRDRAEQALTAAGLVHEVRTYPGADHAFFNDTGPRYNAAAAQAANEAMLGWFGRYLG